MHADVEEVVSEMNGQLHNFFVDGFKDPKFKTAYNFMHFVDTLLQFIKATHTADWGLHMSSSHGLAKIFFAMDHLKYKKLWPHYIADMASSLSVII